MDPATVAQIDPVTGKVNFSKSTDANAEKVGVNVIKSVSASEMPEYLKNLEEKKDQIFDKL